MSEDPARKQPPPPRVQRDMRTLVRREGEFYVDDERYTVDVHPETALARDGGDSLPVLETFRSFLETERKRARDRLLITSAFFTVMLGGILLGSYLVIDHLRSQVDTQAKTVSDIRADLAAEKATAAAKLQSLEERASALRETVSRQLGQVASADRASAEAFTERDAALAAVQAELVSLREARTQDSERYDELLRMLVDATNRPTVIVTAPVTPPAAVRGAEDVAALTNVVAEAPLVVPPAAAVLVVPDQPDPEPAVTGDAGEPPPTVVEVPYTPPSVVLGMEPVTVEAGEPPATDRGDVARAETLRLMITPKGAQQPLAWRMPLP